MADWEFLTFSEKEPHKYRRHATLILAVTILLYGLFLVFPQFLYGYRGIEYAFSGSTKNILRRTITYHTPIILGIVLIVLSGDIIRTGNILTRHVKGATLFFVIAGIKELSFFLMELSHYGVMAFFDIFRFQMGESLLRYSIMLTVIAFSVFVTLSILLERKGYMKKIYLTLVVYFGLSSLNSIYMLIPPPLGSPLSRVHRMIILMGYLLTAIYFLREFRVVGVLEDRKESIHWTLRGALCLFGFDKLVWLGYNLVYHYEHVVERMSELSGYGPWLILIFLVGSSICVGSLLPWKIVYERKSISFI